MFEHLVFVALVLIVLYRIEHHGVHTKRILTAMRDILAHNARTKE